MRADNAGPATAVFHESRGSFVVSDKALVALLGVDNLVVVADEDAVLVARRDQANGMKHLVERLKQVAPKVTEEHLRVHRPWGSYHGLGAGDRYQVKRIIVKPGGRLSLQLHHHRAEHWVVVRGTARVTIGDDVRMLHENEFDLHPDRRAPPAGKPRQDRAGTDRGPERVISRRGRYRPLRGRLPAGLARSRE